MVRRAAILSVAWLGALLLAAGAWPSVHATSPPLRVIAHRSLDVSGLSRSDLRDLFLGRTKRVDGQLLIPLNYDSGSRLRQVFDRAVLDMDPEQVGRYWIDHRIRGGGRPPRSVPSTELMVRVVGALRGAIGYVPAGTALNGNVKVLRVEGFAPP